MIEAYCGNLAKARAEVIVVPSNVLGVCDHGIAEEVKDTSSAVVSKDALYRNKRKLDLGDVYSSDPGKLKKNGVKKIYYSIITSSPGNYSSCYMVEKSLRNVFFLAQKEKIASIAIPGLGIESGLDKLSIALMISAIVKEYSHKMDIYIVDENRDFIEKVKSFLL